MYDDPEVVTGWACRAIGLLNGKWEWIDQRLGCHEESQGGRRIWYGKIERSPRGAPGFVFEGTTDITNEWASDGCLETPWMLSFRDTKEGDIWLF